MKIDLLSSTLLIISAWLIYFVLHSVLANNKFKYRFSSRFPGLAPCYRLVYNIIAIVSLIPILILLFLFQGPLLIEWPQAVGWLKIVLNIFAVAGFLWSLCYYDLAEFSGITECRSKHISDNHFIISPLHRYVRHPWYFFGLIIVWSRDLDLMQLVSTILISGYFIIGSRLEERKLCQKHGRVYQIYRRKVPGLLPIPWKRITKDEAEKLIRQETIN